MVYVLGLYNLADGIQGGQYDVDSICILTCQGLAVSWVSLHMPVFIVTDIIIFALAYYTECYCNQNLLGKVRIVMALPWYT